MIEAHARPRLIFLYGPPAVGKLTVARAIAERGDFRVLHNHVTFDAVAEVLPVGTPTFWEALDKVRLELVTAAAREGIDLVYTFVFASGEEPHVDEVVRAYESAGGSVHFVRLVAPPDRAPSSGHRCITSCTRQDPRRRVARPGASGPRPLRVDPRQGEPHDRCRSDVTTASCEANRREHRRVES